MANRFRNFIESIVYAGMKPGTPNSAAAPPRRFRWLGPLAGALSTPGPSDPLYLTNRTLGQRLARPLMVAIPLVLVVSAVIVAINIYAPKTVKPARQLTNAEIANKVLPNFNKDIQLDTNTNIQVLEVHFEHAVTSQMAGSIQNKTDRMIHEAVVVFDLTDAAGSQLGGVTVRLTDLLPGAIRPFKLPIEQKNAAYGIVREVRTQ